MVDLNVTILECSDIVVDPSQKNNVKNEPKEDVKQPKIDKIVEKYPCDKCEKVFPKFGSKSLHMRKAHNIKTLQYTPAPVNRKVGRPAYRFICDLCKEKKKTESELRNHMTLKHGQEKSDMAEMQQEPIKRMASLKISPPNKKTKAGMKEENMNRELNMKDFEI